DRSQEEAIDGSKDPGIYRHLAAHSKETMGKKLVESDLTNPLTKLLTIAAADKQPPLNDELAKMFALIEEIVTVEDLALHFTLPGYDVELKPSGRESLNDN
ncbi:hypothetical protein EV359DRAFT_65272, partial [Lentinula novae-zelandiae]